MSTHYIESDVLISVAKLKLHSITGMCGVLKNQFGAYPKKYKARFHRRLDDVITDINQVRVPDFCLVDGIYAMEGNGPISGKPKPSGLLIAGNDAVATDHACARLMGLNPNNVSHLQLAIRRHLGHRDYQVLGTAVQDVSETFDRNPFWKRIIERVYNKL
jgi:uncharacterized protein (DUF362 family)